MNNIRQNCTLPITALIVVIVFYYLVPCSAMQVPIESFPTTAYSQNVNDYLPPDKADYIKPLLSPEYQHRQLKQFYNHYYATDPQGLSPWSAEMVRAALPLIKKIEPLLLETFNNHSKLSKGIHFGENFEEHDYTWWSKIRENMDLSSLNLSEFREKNRAIAIINTYARNLPYNAPDFFHASLPGEGFPFDNLQESAIWKGTPLYVLSLSKDKAWSLVLTPDAYFAWIKSDDLSYVSTKFIENWQTAAKNGMVAITQTQASIVDRQGQFQFTGYIGAVFPLVQRNNMHTQIFFPSKHLNQAKIETGIIDNSASTVMPLTASPKNFAGILDQLKNRPYGWGGVFFFNDCSQEVKSIFTPFGIWLPRGSAQIAKFGSSLDLTKNNEDERIQGLKEKGRPLLTLIHVDGHIMLFIGNKVMSNHQTLPITYQDVWGLSPTKHDTRYVIGQSLFLPLQKLYPDTPGARSQASKTFFKLIFLDAFQPIAYSPEAFLKIFSTEVFEQNHSK